MKKIFFVTALFLLVGLASSARAHTGISSQIASAFQKDFAGATSVTWQTDRQFTKATFTLNGVVLFAYYEASGELIATTRNITSSQLPIMLLNKIKAEYSSFWITDLFEISSNNTTSYYITLENAGEIKVLHSDGQEWSMFDNIIKE